MSQGETAPKSPSENLKLNVPQTSYYNSLKDLNTKRSSVKGRITKYKNLLKKITESHDVSPTDLCMLTQRFDKFHELYSTFDELQSQIELLNSSNLESELDTREELEAEFSLLIAQTRVYLDKNKSHKNDFESASENGSHKSSCSHSCDNGVGASFKLPIIKISNFDGSYFKWLEFRDTFTSLIHNNNQIKPIHKFHYLNSYLEGEAARVLTNLEVTTDNYKEAWRLLCERYNNEKQLIKNHLNSLCNIQPVARDSAKGLRFIVDHVSKNLRALSSLGEPTTSWDTLIIHLVSAKLDNNSTFKWEEYKNNFEKSPSLNDFFTFLKGRADILESVNYNKTVNNHPRPDSHSTYNKPDKSHTKSFAISATDAPPAPVCVLCNGSHRIYDCASFLAMSVEDRCSEAARLRLCANCLRKGHSSRQCRLRSCSICKLRHNTLLHRSTNRDPPQAQNTSNVNTSTMESEVGQEENSNIISMSINSSTNESILLSTALVDIYNPSTKSHLTIRALLDSGSQSSLISSDLKTKLDLTPQPTRVNIVGVGNIITSNSLQRCLVQIKSKHSNYSADLSCLVLPNLTGNLPNKSFDLSQINLPTNIKLADPTFNVSAPIDMIIGADIFWSLIESDQLYLGSKQPVMRKTKLGWVLAGALFTQDYIDSTINCNHVSTVDYHSSDYISNETLDKTITKFWESDQIPESSNKVVYTDLEKECEQHFIDNTTRNAEGRFCVKLPLLSEPDCLGDSFRLARRQFFALERRFKNNLELKLLYSKFIEEYHKLGHLSKSDSLIPNQSYFIPHHAVLRPASESTALRVVFNGSARTTSGYSINDLQMTGPHIQDSLFNIILRFRQYAYVLSGDIEKMYRQVEVHESNRNLQMILWRNNETEPLQSFNLNTVTYGYTSSSYLSTRCLWQLGEECHDSRIKEIIQNDFLVDDLLTGSNNQDDLLHIKRTIERCLSKGCFNLRKYRSNAPSVLADSQNTEGNLVISSSSHTLGVGWDPKNDLIQFPSSYKIKKDSPTKRSILSDSCKIFDPLGLLSSITIKPKLLIQKLWIEKADWDTPVSQEVIQSWQSFVNSIESIQDINIPRHAFSINDGSVELHCFCDASKVAFGTCIYVRCIDTDGAVTVRLLCAKARVASVKPTTIPRLELSACLLGAQLAAAVCRALRCVITRKFFWTDSSIALAWLGMRYDRLKTFVANRVGTILELTDDSQWRHVPTDQNPADLASRGISPSDIKNLDFWFNGPSFLSQPEHSWPTLNTKPNDLNEIPEIKTVKINTCTENTNNKLINFEDHSNVNRLQRSFSYVLRFIHNCRNKQRKTGILQPEELTASLELLVKLAQEETFSKELSILKNNKPLNPKNPLLSLNPFLDSNDILRVGGRLDSSCYSFEKRHPMLLHSKHTLTKLLFRREHILLLHAGPQLLLSSIREYIWPIAGRDLARTTARQCVVCRKVSGKTTTPIMGSLPKQRVDPGFPFLSTGVDFAGPFLITDRKGRGCKITKCYLCLFVCFRYKCLHLEAVSELSKDSFILSLRRFISRRGKPREFFCDNGRNFVGAAREIGEFLTSNSGDISAFFSELGIKFNFQPAYAPHFGGLWEAGVKSAKYYLKRILGNCHLTFEELATLFTQIEAILNSRPLCPLSSSPNDYQPLTPGHFLIGRPLLSFPSPNLEDAKMSRLDRYQRLEHIRQHFWNRWQREYVTEMQQRQKWRIPTRQLQIGDLVLLKEENLPPMSWRLGRITSLFPGKDKVARVAEVKTTHGTFRRGVKYLCPLLEPADTSLEPEDSKAPEYVQSHH
ncbi:uncharacterized protein LOC125490601 [Plutella xylostella]|uniref:uncharacterized protein LOC125490601 n=1 Tax=Plutella xylostella TaxID=51655 RepID=UPI0020327E1C|nr:uncharacterized protein LOC125490601 [Plutella xylostella]